MCVLIIVIHDFSCTLCLCVLSHQLLLGVSKSVLSVNALESQEPWLFTGQLLGVPDLWALVKEGQLECGQADSWRLAAGPRSLPKLAYY